MKGWILNRLRENKKIIRIFKPPDVHRFVVHVNVMPSSWRGRSEFQAAYDSRTIQILYREKYHYQLQGYRVSILLLQ